MSMAPLQADGNDVRWGVSLGSGLKMRDSLWDGLTDQHVGTPMGITAENLAEKYGISREVCLFATCVFIYLHMQKNITYTRIYMVTKLATSFA